MAVQFSPLNGLNIHANGDINNTTSQYKSQYTMHKGDELYKLLVTSVQILLHIQML